MSRYLATGESTVLGHRLELHAMRKDGNMIPVEVRIQAVKLEGELLFCAFLHDITARKEMEAIREHEARHDTLTGLPNRRSFFEILSKAIARCERNQFALALLFIDLDGFKAVNDLQGHYAGDALLREIAGRLSSVVRQTDTVARLGGDEFVVILENLAAEDPNPHLIAHKILSCLEAPIALDHGAAQVGASIGIAVHLPGQSVDVDALINRADKAMYEAKRAGKNRIMEA